MTPREKIRYEIGRWFDHKVQAQITAGGSVRAVRNLRKQGMPAPLAALLVASRAADRPAPPYLVCLGCQSQIPRTACPACRGDELVPMVRWPVAADLPPKQPINLNERSP